LWHELADFLPDGSVAEVSTVRIGEGLTRLDLDVCDRGKKTARDVAEEIVSVIEIEPWWEPGR
jgi:hypothetical protein